MTRSERDGGDVGVLSPGDRRSRVPGFVLSLTPGDQEWSDLGVPAWPDVPTLLLYGRWPEVEVRRVRHPLGRLLVLGHLLGSHAELSRTLDTALRTDDFAGLRTLPGAYAYVVLRPSGVVVGGDDAGQYPIHHSRRGDETLIGMHPNVLAARHERRPDPVTMAVHIACGNVLPLLAGRSHYDGIASVPPGGVLHAGPGGLWIEDPVWGAGDSTRLDGARVLRAELVRAVRERCWQGPISADFSGGLDSTSLALLAARYSPHDIQAVAYQQSLAPADDVAFAERYAEAEPRIRLEVVRGDETTLPYQALPHSDGENTDEAVAAEPASGVVAARRALLRLTRTAVQQSSLHLTGEGGDAVLGAPPAYLADAARRHSWRQLVNRCSAHARLRQTSPVGLLWRACVTASTGPRGALNRLSRVLQNPAAAPLTWQASVSWWPTSGEAIGWLTADTRRTLAQLAADPATARKVPTGMGAADLLTAAEVRNSALAQRYLRELGARVGVAVHAPFLDNRVVAACLRVRPADRGDPWSCKPMLGYALDGLVPEPVFTRLTKGDYTQEDYLGVRRAAGWLTELLADSRMADLGVIEPHRVRASLHRMRAGAATSVGALNQVIATELWLRGVV